MSLAVVALGGNAILKAGQEATIQHQMENLEGSAQVVLDVMERYDAILLSHGNGPQVGNIVLQNQLSRDEIPSMPLDVCVAESQGQIGYMIQLALLNAMVERKVRADIVCCLTAVEVIQEKEARAIKPIGPYYSKREAEELKEELGWRFAQDLKRGGYRRVVPSPPPQQVLGLESIRRLFRHRRKRPLVVVAGGGGGVPLRRNGSSYQGMEAVVDKDLTAALMACYLRADTLIMLTDIDAVYRDFRTKAPSPIRQGSAKEMRSLLREGHFPPGSMGPKVEAALRFVECQGRAAIITDAQHLLQTLRGEAGTTIGPER